MKFIDSKKRAVIFTGIIISVLVFFLMVYQEIQTGNHKMSREEYEKFINNHKYSKRTAAGLYEKIDSDEEELKSDRPDLAFEQDFLMTMDPAIGYPPKKRLYSVYEKVKQFKNLKAGIPGDAMNNWVERGPNNVGGRVRAILFDPNDASNKKVWAGSVSGGLWYNNDITDVSSSWHAVDDFWANIAISTIAYDPSNTQIFYVGTGEGWYNSDAVEGAGIWKSVDAGQTWFQLSSTISEDFRTVQKIQVSNSGRVIVATSGGIYTSDDGGTIWTKKITGFGSDLEIASDGTIYAGKGRIYITGAIYKSIDDGSNWTNITPSATEQERVELAVASTNSQLIYAIATKGKNISWFKKSNDGGTTWINILIPKYIEQNCVESATYDFTREQAWFDLILAVHPTNANIVMAGGIDLYKTTNGGVSWKAVSNWLGDCYPYVHADQHAIVFRPGTTDEIVVGNDGGVSYSADAGASATPEFSDRNKDLNITQYYSCALHPEPLKHYFLGGTQDNGSHKFGSTGMNSIDFITAGDGAYCFIDQKNPEIQISSVTYNNYYISRNAWVSFTSLLSQSDGSFINPSDYDDNLHILYSAKGTNSINRVKDILTVPINGSFTISALGTTASHIKVSHFTTSSSTLFIGTEAGRIFKVKNAETDSPIPDQITGSGFPAGYISCIDLGASEDEILVTFSNYGVSSVWYTSDGGLNWSEKEGNLPDMPVRWALFNPNNRNEVILATEVGVWSTSNFGDVNPGWNPSNSGLANVRVNMFQIRESDYEVLAATHGRGFFTSDAFSPIDKNELAAYFSTKGTTKLKFGGTIQFEDLSTGDPTSYNWTFEGGKPESSNEPNPLVSYDSSGIYDVSLTVSNGMETKSMTKSAYIAVGGSNMWKEQASGFPNPGRGIDYIDMVNNEIVWATNYDGSNPENPIKEFTKTVDGGNHWTPGIIDLPGDIYPAMVCAINKDTAWIPMYPGVAGAGGGIYITTDGGVSWTKQNSASFTGSDAFANVVHFWNKNEGFCMGDPNGGEFEIYTTTNGGNNWTKVPASNIPNPSGSDEYGTVGQFCVGEDGVVFFNTTKGRIFKSKNKGASWSVISTPLKGSIKIAFADENNGVLMESYNNVNTFKVYYTTNGGLSWNATDRQNVYPSFIEYVPGTGRMYISSSGNSGKSGTSYSIDGGLNWTRFSDLEQTQCLALDFYNMSLGWVGQFNSSSYQGGILKYSGMSTIPDFLISPASPVIEAPVLFSDNSLSIESSNSYSWNFGEDASPPTANTVGPHTITYSSKGNKTVSLSVNGNSVIKTFNIAITGIEAINKQFVFNLYPNPSSGIFNLQMKQNKKMDFNVSIYNLKGQIVYYNEISNSESEWNLPINLTNLGKGLYILRIKGNGINETGKIVIK